MYKSCMLTGNESSIWNLPELSGAFICIGGNTCANRTFFIVLFIIYRAVL